MTRSQKKELCRILAAAVLLAAASLLPLEGLARLAVFLVPYFVVGWSVLWKAARNIAHGQVFDENFLMALATVGALVIGEYPEAVFVMLFYQIGELFEHVAVGKSRKSIAALMDIRPDTANLERGGELVEVDPEEVAVGSIIVVRPGEKVPIDGVVVEGTSSLDTAALTGESLPRDVAAGDAVISGCVSLSGVLRLRTTRSFGESTVSKILDLVENSAANKSRSEAFITRFARWYTPAVVVGAVLLAIVPSLVTGDWTRWIHQALTFLVISCPCALVVSVPLSFFGGIGGASRCGILVKGSNHLEDLGRTGTVVFDKTGTLTRGVFRVTAVHPETVSEEELLELAALAESYSGHPISLSLREAHGRELDQDRVRDVQELSGHGIRAVVDGRTVFAGNEKLMAQAGVPCRSCELAGTIVHVAADGVYMGHIVISDEIKDDAADAIRALKAQGIRTVMLTGDRQEVADHVAGELALDEVHAELLPADKVAIVERLLQEHAGRGKLAFVGDGINDAPVLSRADIGVAMGALGSDAAIEAADVVLMDDKPSKLSQAMAISRRTNRIVRQNIVFALAVKAVVLVMGVCGVATMWEAVFADVGVLVLAICNATRTLKVPESAAPAPVSAR